MTDENILETTGYDWDTLCQTVRLKLDRHILSNMTKSTQRRLTL